MESQQLEILANAFAANPDPEKAMQIIAASRLFICKHARKWQNSGLSLFERIREIMAEMFLILLEDFQPQKMTSTHGLLAFLGLKLRRLTRPASFRAISFGLSGELENLGRYNFSAFRLQLVNEIVLAVRKALAQQSEKQSGLLELLFIHVYPEISWASNILADFFGEDQITRHNADRKRHLVFNRTLKSEFSQLPSGDWRDIRDWSGGERSYLADRIIELSPHDLGEGFEDEWQIVSEWRTNFDKHARHENARIKSAQRVFRALQSRSEFKETSLRVLEEAAEYEDGFDLIGTLLKPVFAQEGVAETAQTYTAENKAPSSENTDSDNGAFIDDEILDEEFNRAATEINDWLQTLLSNSSFSHRA